MRIRFINKKVSNGNQDVTRRVSGEAAVATAKTGWLRSNPEKRLLRLPQVRARRAPPLYMYTRRPSRARRCGDIGCRLFRLFSTVTTFTDIHHPGAGAT